MRRRVDHLSAMLSKSATMNADGVAAAAAAAKPEGGMPLPKLSKKEDAPADNSADIMKMQHELAGKDKEIAKLNSKMQEIKFDMQRTKMQAEFADERNKMMSQIRNEQLKLKSELSARQKELDARQQKFKDEEAKHRADLINAEAQHKAKLQQELAEHKVQLAEQKSQSLMDIANMQTDQYIKMTDKARKETDAYYADKEKKYKESHPGINPLLQQRLEQLGSSTSRLAKLKFNKLATATSYGEPTEIEVNGVKHKVPPGQVGAFLKKKQEEFSNSSGNPGASPIKPITPAPTSTPAPAAAPRTGTPTQATRPAAPRQAPPAVVSSQAGGPNTTKTTRVQPNTPQPSGPPIPTTTKLVADNSGTHVGNESIMRKAKQNITKLKSMGLRGNSSVSDIERRQAEIEGQINSLKRNGQPVPPDLYEQLRFLQQHVRTGVNNMQRRMDRGEGTEADRVDMETHKIQNEAYNDRSMISRAMDWLSGDKWTNVNASQLDRIRHADEYAERADQRGWFAKNRALIMAGIGAGLQFVPIVGNAVGAGLLALAAADGMGTSINRAARASDINSRLGTSRGWGGWFDDGKVQGGSELARNAAGQMMANEGLNTTLLGDVADIGGDAMTLVPGLGAIGKGSKIVKGLSHFISPTQAAMTMASKVPGVSKLVAQGARMANGFGNRAGRIAQSFGASAKNIDRAQRWTAGAAKNLPVIGGSMYGDIKLYGGMKEKDMQVADHYMQQYGLSDAGYNQASYMAPVTKIAMYRNIDSAIETFEKSAWRSRAQRYNDGEGFNQDPSYENMLKQGPLSRTTYRQYVMPILEKITGKAFHRDYEWRPNTQRRWIDPYKIQAMSMGHEALGQRYEHGTPYGNDVAHAAMKMHYGDNVIYK